MAVSSTGPAQASARRYWDRSHGLYVVKIHPGEFFVSGAGEAIATVLGSCVAACIRDRETGVGGMNHFMLPDRREGPEEGDAGNRYGIFAMENMINQILKEGGRRSGLEAKVFGGARIQQHVRNSVGWSNIGFVLDFLATEGIPLLAQDVGNAFPRRVVFFPRSGRARVLRLASNAEVAASQEEAKYRVEIEKGPGDGDVEWFG